MQVFDGMGTYYKYIYIIDEKTSVCDPIEQEINSFASLPNGWDYGEGLPPAHETISNGITIYRIGKRYNLSVEVLPLAEGEIIVSFSKGETFIDILIGNNGTYRLSVEIGIGNNYEVEETINNASIEVIEDRLRKLSGYDEWKSLESSGNKYSVVESSGSGEKVSEIIGEPFLW